MAEVVLTRTDDAVRTITLNRPEARNALNSEVMAAFADALDDAETDDAVSVIVLTGADPAFCAGLDLRELGSTAANLVGTGSVNANPFSVLWRMTKPVIGAVNGPAVTGGLEIALNCDLLVASDRARFADTHARVGALPGGGMTPLLPQAVGIRKAREMSFTGNFVDAAEALRLGLVNHVVPHEQLLATALDLARDVAGNDQRTLRRLKRNYDLGVAMTLDDCWKLEREEFVAWRVQPEEVERRRASIVERGRSQTSAKGDGD
ncbi:MAG: enoyl-CoA hydratase [Actinobacteria bacterium]|nr:enoyl-CoA hydratase [Actinomycetota bacterium]